MFRIHRVQGAIVILGIASCVLNGHATATTIDSPVAGTQVVTGPDVLNLVSGGSITVADGFSTVGINALSNAQINILGGSIDAFGEPVTGVRLRGGSDLTMAAGEIISGQEDRSAGVEARTFTSEFTSVQISGGSIAATGNRSSGLDLYAWDNSSINATVTGGNIAATGDRAIGIQIFARNNSSINATVTGGNTNASGDISQGIRIDADDGSTVSLNIINGAVSGDRNGISIARSGDTTGTIRVNISGGSVTSILSAIESGRSTNVDVEVIIKGGTVEGGINAIAAGGASRYVITGGTIRGQIDTENDARVDIFGGNLFDSGNGLDVTDNSLINLYVIGNNVTVDGLLVPVTPASSTAILATTGTIAGTLADRTDFSYQFSRENTASLIIHSVPEPSTIGLLLSAALLMVHRSRDKWVFLHKGT